MENLDKFDSDLSQNSEKKQELENRSETANTSESLLSDQISEESEFTDPR